MSLLKPYSRLTRNRLTTLINNDSDRDRVEGVDFNYGIPQSATGPNGTNTIVSLIPTQTSGECTVTNVYYNRLPLSMVTQSFYKPVNPIIVANLPFTAHQILPEINQVYGLNLTQNEVENTTYVNVQDTYQLTIGDGSSLIWLPGTMEFSVTILNVPNIGESINQDSFDGFSQSDAELGYAFFTDILNGFVTEPQDLVNAMQSTYLDGFDSTDNRLSNKINDYLDGFEGSDMPLGINIYGTQLNGFGITEVFLEEVINAQLDGFDIPLTNVCELVSTETLDGFNRIYLDISTLMNSDELPGFTYIDIDINETIRDVLDGIIPNTCVY